MNFACGSPRRRWAQRKPPEHCKNRFPIWKGTWRIEAWESLRHQRQKTLIGKQRCLICSGTLLTETSKLWHTINGISAAATSIPWVSSIGGKRSSITRWPEDMPECECTATKHG